MPKHVSRQRTDRQAQRVSIASPALHPALHLSLLTPEPSLDSARSIKTCFDTWQGIKNGRTPLSTPRGCSCSTPCESLPSGNILFYDLIIQIAITANCAPLPSLGMLRSRSKLKKANPVGKRLERGRRNSSINSVRLGCVNGEQVDN